MPPTDPETGRDPYPATGDDWNDRLFAREIGQARERGAENPWYEPPRSCSHTVRGRAVSGPNGFDDYELGDDPDRVDAATELLIVDGLPNDDLPDLPVPPSDLKPRWETFARLYAFGKPAAAAARIAGFSPRNAAHAGWRLLQDARIHRRISQLRQFADDHRAHDRDQLAVRLEAIYREAMECGHLTAAVRAVEVAERLMRHEGRAPAVEAKS